MRTSAGLPAHAAVRLVRAEAAHVVDGLLPVAVGEHLLEGAVHLAEPAHVDTQRWLYAQTVNPLGQSHLWDRKAGLGVCGDWCLGHRVEDGFVSGLELALTVA